MNIYNINKFFKPCINSVRDYKRKVLFFPAVLGFLIILLTICQISGTSIGIYHSYLFGKDIVDTNLIFNKPQSIRSDEWLVTTQLTIAQAENDFQPINNNFNGGKDISLLADAPHRGWSALFKPQNLAFFILPLEYAFAFKWWLLLFILAIAVYFFCLRLVSKNILFAVACSLAISCSPFVFWWYQTATIGTLCYGFLIMLASMSIIDNKKLILFRKELSIRKSILLKILALSYLLIAFAFILYPPFQISVAIVIIFFLTGYLIKSSVDKNKKQILAILTSFLMALAVSGGVVSLYVINHSETIKTISNTVYPGKRIVQSGGYDIKRILVTYLQPQLQREERGVNYITNQSESSSFILMPIFFILPATGLIVWIYIKYRKVEWVLLFILLCALVFLSNLFIPGLDLVSKLFLLHLVPHDRLLIGLGFLAIIMVIYMAKITTDNNFKMTRNMKLAAIIYSFIFFVAIVLCGIITSSEFPKFISNKYIVVALAAIQVIGFGALIINNKRLGISIIASLSIASVILIHPLYRGLGPIYNSSINQAIKELSSKQDVWAAAQDIYIENLPQMSGRPAVTGVSTYPNNQFWKNYSGLEGDEVYNRYSHSFLSTNNSGSLVLIAPDLYSISGSCERKINQKIDYIISVTPIESSCNKLIRVLSYPNGNFYFYKQ